MWESATSGMNTVHRCAGVCAFVKVQYYPLSVTSTAHCKQHEEQHNKNIWVGLNESVNVGNIN